MVAVYFSWCCLILAVAKYTEAGYPFAVFGIGLLSALLFLSMCVTHGDKRMITACKCGTVHQSKLVRNCLEQPGIAAQVLTSDTPFFGDNLNQRMIRVQVLSDESERAISSLREHIKQHAWQEDAHS